MQVHVLKEMMSLFGAVGRVYLVPIRKVADSKTSIERKNFNIPFKHGWVEFIDKKAARKAADMLNGQPIMGKKHVAWSGELWNLRYLKNFKWQNLKEQDEFDENVKRQRMRLEISQSRKEVAEYTKNVEIAIRKKARSEEIQPKEFEELKRRFKQRKIVEE